MIRGLLAALLLLGDDEPVDPSKYKHPTEARRADIERGASQERAYLGISPGEQTEESTGVLLSDVPQDGPAAKAGVKAGDRILRFDGEEVKDYNSLGKLIGTKKPGDKVEVVVDRGGEELSLVVTLGARSGGMLQIWRKSEFRLGLVLLEFPDGRHNPEFTKADFERMLFSRKEYTGRNVSGERVHGSLADYYRENSSGKLSVTGRVFDWVTLEEPRGYFEEKPMGDRDGFRKLFTRALELVRERDGEECFDNLDGIIFLYAGRQTYKRPWLLWPHRANIKLGKRTVPYYLTAEGGRYFNAINVHVHEFGHMLGLPDQYGQKHATGVGKWCTMAVGHMGGGESGPHRPFHLCVWCKDQLGWVTTVPVKPGDAQWLKLPAIESEATAVRILLKPDGSDSLYLENRQRIGFDSDLEGAGLLIWRVRRGSVDLVEAHGRKASNASLLEPDQIPWPSLYNRDYTPATSPASPEGVFVVDIAQHEGVAYFKIGVEKTAKTTELRKSRDY